jgi:hypothetical protein
LEFDKRGDRSRVSVPNGPMQFEPTARAASVFPSLAPADLPEGKLLSRLGDVLYWLCCVVALLVFAWGAWSEFGGTSADGPYLFALASVAAFAIWIIGRACRYILSGK